MEKTTEKIPTWSLCYLVNGDASGLTDEELQTIDRWYKDMGVQVVSPVMDDGCSLQPYFSHCPAFGLPTEEWTATSFISNLSNNDNHERN